MLQLKHLEILRFRSVPPGTRLTFNSGHNILLGKNGTGKTTLLKLIAAAASVNFHEFQEEEFELAWVMTLGEHELRCKASHVKEPPSPLSPELAGLTSNPWHSRVDIEVWDNGSNSGRVTWRDGQVETERRDEETKSYLTQFSFISQPGSNFIARVVLEDLVQRKRGPLLVKPTLFGFATTVPRLDESLVWFHHEVIRSAMLTVAEMKPASSLLPYFSQPFRIPSSFFSSIDHERSIDSRPYLEVTSDDQPMLMRACEALGFAQCTLRVEFDLSEKGSREHQGVERTLYYKNIRFTFTKKDGTRLSHAHLSFGQLRLFAFLYYAELFKGIIVADELTNGLHHSMIDLCLDTIGDRQSFLATQNPLLLDHIGFHSAEEVQRTFILCDLLELTDGQESMQWRNMSDEEAGEFFGDYEVGIQHVNDILRTRGLW